MKEFVAFIVGVVIAGLGLATNCLAQTTPKSVDRLLSIYSKGSPRDFPLVTERGASPIYLDAQDFPVVQIAANALASDIESVTKTKPRVVEDSPAEVESMVLIGTLGKSRLIEYLVTSKKLDVSGMAGAWESFVVATVLDPLPGVKRGLVIAGSDRRGTAYGVFTLSEAIGVSHQADRGRNDAFSETCMGH